MSFPRSRPLTDTAPVMEIQGRKKPMTAAIAPQPDTFSPGDIASISALAVVAAGALGGGAYAIGAATGGAGGAYAKGGGTAVGGGAYATGGAAGGGGGRVAPGLVAA